mmetsp:Transcript_40041/g.64088  ORF Transcript_40041/g.64088 Transcript_40041/m.64088 type:complete len:420 (-) Transcript_40041:109-1368(-)
MKQGNNIFLVTFLLFCLLCYQFNAEDTEAESSGDESKAKYTGHLFTNKEELEREFSDAELWTHVKADEADRCGDVSISVFSHFDLSEVCKPVCDRWIQKAQHLQNLCPDLFMVLAAGQGQTGDATATSDTEFEDEPTASPSETGKSEQPEPSKKPSNAEQADASPSGSEGGEEEKQAEDGKTCEFKKLLTWNVMKIDEEHQAWSLPVVNITVHGERATCDHSNHEHTLFTYNQNRGCWQHLNWGHPVKWEPLDNGHDAFLYLCSTANERKYAFGLPLDTLYEGHRGVHTVYITSIFSFNHDWKDTNLHAVVEWDIDKRPNFLPDLDAKRKQQPQFNENVLGEITHYALKSTHFHEAGFHEKEKTKQPWVDTVYDIIEKDYLQFKHCEAQKVAWPKGWWRNFDASASNHAIFTGEVPLPC